MVEHDGRISGYSTGLANFAHTVGETNEDLKALIGAASEFAGPGILVPLANTELVRWCLASGLRVVQLMTLMTIGPRAGRGLQPIPGPPRALHDRASQLPVEDLRRRLCCEQPGDLDGPLPHKWPITERKMKMSTKANTPIKLKRLVLLSILYLSFASLGAVVAIVLDRPAQFGGSTSGLPVVQDFIFGMGTAMSPPLLWWMVPQGFLTWVAWNQMNRRSTWGVIGLTLFGGSDIHRRGW